MTSSFSRKFDIIPWHAKHQRLQQSSKSQKCIDLPIQLTLRRKVLHLHFNVLFLGRWKFNKAVKRQRIWHLIRIKTIILWGVVPFLYHALMLIPIISAGFPDLHGSLRRGIWIQRSPQGALLPEPVIFHLFRQGELIFNYLIVDPLNWEPLFFSISFSRAGVTPEENRTSPIILKTSMNPLLD